ncbi:MAG: hypothetical protein R2788_08920 [Saprospiraceae bacterium]
MKNRIAILLLLVIGCPSIGTRAFLLIRKSAIRQTVKKRILAGVERNELVQLTFAIKDLEVLLKWEHSREFEYRDEMYDLVESETCGDSIRYWCIHDRAETEINRHLDSLTTKSTNSDPLSRKCLTQYFDFLKHIFSPQDQLKPIALFDCGEIRHHFLRNEYAIQISPPTPPPEVANSVLYTSNLYC